MGSLYGRIHKDGADGGWRCAWTSCGRPTTTTSTNLTYHHNKTRAEGGKAPLHASRPSTTIGLFQSNGLALFGVSHNPACDGGWPVAPNPCRGVGSITHQKGYCTLHDITFEVHEHAGKCNCTAQPSSCDLGLSIARVSRSTLTSGSEIRRTCTRAAPYGLRTSSAYAKYNPDVVPKD